MLLAPLFHRHGTAHAFSAFRAGSEYDRDRDTLMSHRWFHLWLRIEIRTSLGDAPEYDRLLRYPWRTIHLISSVVQLPPVSHSTPDRGRLLGMPGFDQRNVSHYLSGSNHPNTMPAVETVIPFRLRIEWHQWKDRSVFARLAWRRVVGSEDFAAAANLAGGIF